MTSSSTPFSTTSAGRGLVFRLGEEVRAVECVDGEGAVVHKGYGSVTPAQGGDDVFVHFSVITGEGYRSLNERARVEYKVEQGPKGLQATNVTIVE
jgi:CspA family cold shock protein